MTRAPRRVKPSPTQLKIMQNVEAGREPFYGRPMTQSDAAGWSTSLSAAQRRGWMTYPGCELTDMGRLELGRIGSWAATYRAGEWTLWQTHPQWGAITVTSPSAYAALSMIRRADGTIG